ncbi:MAG: hypothetical protein LBJ13_03765 [Puniceicoccales bacterium]|jgi:hypothetical protein|nr:hypothetical protein [Puniceicoccales bacterium]
MDNELENMKPGTMVICLQRVIERYKFEKTLPIQKHQVHSERTMIGLQEI